MIVSLTSKFILLFLLFASIFVSLSALPIDTASNSSTSELVETSLPNFFTSLSPAEGLLLPIFPPTERFIDENSTEAPEETDETDVTTRKPDTPSRHVIDVDNIVRSEFVNGIHKITSDRQSFEFKVLQTGDDSGAILTENAIVYGLPSSEGSNFLIAFPIEPNPSLVAATISTSPDAFVSVDEQSISQILAEDSPQLENLSSLPHTSSSLFHDETPSASTLFELPATALLTSFTSTDQTEFD